MTIAKFQDGGAVTMTSLELVDFINGRRAEDDPVLDHADFMKKVPRVLKKDAGKFSDIYFDSMNRRQKCYRFPKRESCLMAMSYSYDLQAAVFDYMTELEQRLAQQNAFVLPRTRAEAMRLAADLEEQNEVLALENQQQAETIASLESLFMTGETPTQFCKRLNGVNCSRVNSSLLALGWLWDAATEENSKPRYRVASRVRDRYLTERPRKISAEGVDPFIKYDLVLLIDGARRLHQLYMKSELAMKSKWDGQHTLAKYDGSAN
ncbi:phage antirepressor protein [Pseudomonas sp. D47]|uniref:phage antirepressor protein n=1 Tax=Pseudomonas sp. D47 TaxID=3159447 RepID=UPI00387AB1E1